ncbi:DUF4105 domain-containing protein [Denitrificimonas sp. JX-1]|uniref:DUF4105 domain-containing protein n=1 Tax=Denitrificimonas halotolerans TaxID=3098930 RepID=A0ABU5GQQ4_9GAMM|nr:DUF4105 domain-containing protein [Denitrificimonas sp. JX-1]MDY7218937.1 DUF4105 domain-containing protein [Denitrificimonas sp. JX-1]
MIARSLVAGVILFPPAIFADNTPLLSHEKLTSLAAHQQWAHLLHYRNHTFTGRYISQNDSPNFFLSPNGKSSLTNELEANLQAFMQTNLADNQSAQCRFPARYYWLKQQLPELNMQDQPCSEFQKWQQELNTDHLTLIFPASHINSPSSMYGHTLIRLDKKDPRSNKLLAHSVNFAANPDPNDNEIVFSWKGLTGGYPGVVSVLPYYAKTNEYSHMEYRDIWEYKLNLDNVETNQFVRHIWETKDTFFDYFFFDENCSYRLLALLDASSERIDVTDDFTFTALPVDTIRALQQRGLIGETEYRPSAASEMEHKSQQASKQVLSQARRLVEQTEPVTTTVPGLNQQDTLQALELAYAYARYLAVQKKQASPVLRQRTLEILSARAKYAEPTAFSPISKPNHRDDEGHLSQRLQAQAGTTFSDEHKHSNKDRLGFVDLNYRAAFHEVMDPPQGFVPGSQIQMANVTLRLWEGGKARLQQLQVVDILSLSEQTYFQRPIAWSVSGGLDRFIGSEAGLYGYLHTGFGKAWLTPVGRFYTLAQAHLMADNQFDKGAQLSVGPRLGWLWQGEQFQAQLEANWQRFSWLDKTERTTIKAKLGWRLATNTQIKLEASSQHFKLSDQMSEQYEVKLGLNWYY